MKSPLLYLLLAGLLTFGLLSCYHPQSSLIPTGEEEEVIDENVLEISFALPNKGPTEGGMQIAVVGRYFHAGTQVYIDNVLCTNIQVVSSGYIQCEIPAHAAGTVDLRVEDPVTMLTQNVVDGFTYTTAPFLIKVTPAQGTATGGTLIYLDGFNFVSGATVLLGASAGLNVGFVNSRRISCETPPGAVGPVDVTVTNPDAQFDTLEYGFNYTLPPPDPQSVTPNTGDNMGGTNVQIDGDWFQTGAAVQFGSNYATNVVVVDQYTITCTTPAGPVGTPVDIVVQNPDSQVGVLSGAFSYFYVNPPPTVTAVTPTSGLAAGNEPVTVTGTGFLNGASVTFGLAPAGNVVVVSSTSITCTTPGGSGTVPVTVTNPDTQSDTLQNAFTFVGGGSGGTPGNKINAFVWDTAAACDWWYCDFMGTDYATWLINAGLSTGASPAAMVDLFCFDHIGGQILETSSVAYQRNTNGTGISGSSYNISFIGDGSQTASWVLGTNYSRMEFGNADPNAGGALGRAIVDSLPGYKENNQLSSGLGIFCGEMTSVWGTLNPAVTTADQTYVDGTYVLGTGNDNRYNQINNYFAQCGMRLGFVNAHETGHSVGLLHCNNPPKCIENPVLNVSGTFTNASYSFCSAHRGNLATHPGITPVFARETLSVKNLAQRADAVVRGTVLETGVFPGTGESYGWSFMRVRVEGGLKGSTPAVVRVMVEETVPAQLPPVGTAALLFLGVPDTAKVPVLSGYYTARGSVAGVVSLEPAVNPQGPEILMAAAVYADGQSTEAQVVARLMMDFRAGERLARDAVVALSRMRNCAAYLSDADRALLVSSFPADGDWSAFQWEVTNYVVLLRHLADGRAVDRLLAFLANPWSYGQEQNAADALLASGGEAAVLALAATLPGEETVLLGHRLDVLGRTGHEAAFDRASAYLASSSDYLRSKAIVATGRTGHAGATALLRDILYGETASFSDKQLAAVALSYESAGVAVLAQAETSHPDAGVRDFVYHFRRNAVPVRVALVGGE